MNDDFFDPNNQFERLKNVENSVGSRHFNTDKQTETDIKLIVNEKISPAKFRAHAFLINTFEANSLTIRAVRKDLFAAGDELFIDLEVKKECHCGKVIDLQFWKICPYCGKEF